MLIEEQRITPLLLPTSVIPLPFHCLCLSYLSVIWHSTPMFYLRHTTEFQNPNLKTHPCGMDLFCSSVGGSHHGLPFAVSPRKVVVWPHSTLGFMVKHNKKPKPRFAVLSPCPCPCANEQGSTLSWVKPYLHSHMHSHKGNCFPPSNPVDPPTILPNLRSLPSSPQDHC